MKSFIASGSFIETVGSGARRPAICSEGAVDGEVSRRGSSGTDRGEDGDGFILAQGWRE